MEKQKLTECQQHINSEATVVDFPVEMVFVPYKVRNSEKTKFMMSPWSEGSSTR